MGSREPSDAISDAAAYGRWEDHVPQAGSRQFSRHSASRLPYSRCPRRIPGLRPDPVFHASRAVTEPAELSRHAAQREPALHGAGLPLLPRACEHFPQQAFFTFLIASDMFPSGQRRPRRFSIRNRKLHASAVKDQSGPQASLPRQSLAGIRLWRDRTV